MSGSTLRRLSIAVLALALWLTPVSRAHAASRSREAVPTLETRIEQIGRILLQTIEKLVQGPPPPSTANGSNPSPNESDGVGIDPHGGFPGR